MLHFFIAQNNQIEWLKFTNGSRPSVIGHREGVDQGWIIAQNISLGDIERLQLYLKASAFPFHFGPKV